MDKKVELTEYEKQAKERIRFVVDQFCGGSQQKLADIADVNKGSVSQYLNGKNTPSTFTAEKICRPFGLDPVWLMGFDVPMIRPQTLRSDSGDMSDPRNLILQEIVAVLDKMNKESLERVDNFVKKVYEIQNAEEELK